MQLNCAKFLLAIPPVVVQQCLGVPESLHDGGGASTFTKSKTIPKEDNEKNQNHNCPLESSPLTILRRLISHLSCFSLPMCNVAQIIFFLEPPIALGETAK